MPWRILLVDDSPTARLYLKRVLSVSGFPIAEFLQASDGLAAVSLLERGTVDLLITDINMPNMGGDALIRWVRSREAMKSIPVVVVSTDSSTARLQQLEDVGINGFVAKPYSPESLRAEIGRVMAVDSGHENHQ